MTNLVCFDCAWFSAHGSRCCAPVPAWVYDEASIEDLPGSVSPDDSAMLCNSFEWKEDSDCLKPKEEG